MWEYIEERARRCAEFIVETGCTVRACSAHFHISKSTVHKDVSERLRYIDKELFDEITILKKEEVELLQNFFCTLGKFDVYNQTKELNLYSMKFNELYKVANEECKKYASLVTKLALIVGLLVCLLII